MVFTAISKGELGEGGVFERVVAELLFIDHLREGVFRWEDPGRLTSDTSAEWGAPPIAALSVCELLRLKKLDILRLKLEVEPRVDRLERGTGVGSCSDDGVAGIGVNETALSGRCC